MKWDSLALAVSLGVNVTTLVFFMVQTTYLARQTRVLNRSLEYAAYQKLVDYLNDVNLMVIQNEKVAEAFADFYFVKDQLSRGKTLTVQQIGLAWLILNRYEAALVGYELGVVPEREWQVWLQRLTMDLKIPLIRDVWLHDISSFGYKETFRDLVFRLAAGIEPATPPDTPPE